MTLVTEPKLSMEPEAALRRVLFLKNAPEAAVCALVRAGRVWQLDKGEALFCEHDRCLGLLVVLTGAVKTFKLDSRGRELTLDLETPGGSVAELPLFDGGNYPASAEAAEDGTRVFVVPRERFQAALAAHPELALQAVKSLGTRMRKLLWMLEAQTLYSVRARLADYLLRVADGQEEFRLDETNEAIGSRIGTVREVVSRTLHSFKDAGVITLRGRWVTLRDPQGLRRITGGEDG